MAASSSSEPRKSYHVFLSFRGPDVRNNFLGHLNTALHQQGIYTYVDDEELRKGEEISPALMNAIEDSRIAIIIFSKDYASSAWCLKELTKIMECRKQEKLIVLPVFYKVEPCEVRTPRESYKKALAKHENKFGKDPEEVKRWKKALFDASFLSGWHFTDGSEAALIEEIVQEMSTQLDGTPLVVAKHPVGLASRVQELKSILNLQFKNNVLMVGLWGQGGVGKTTLAKAVYNDIFREFQGSSFVEHVRENSENINGLVSLQKKLLSETLHGKELTVCSADQGSGLIQQRLCNKKVLIILDDVNEAHQLNALAGNCEWFGKGSRIIITTRNKHLLISHEIVSDHICEVKTLADGEALELFGRHAFLRNQQTKIRNSLVDSVLAYARGLPLALEVLGAFLFGRGEREWEETLEKLAENPNQRINSVLRVSYDGLEKDEKEIFLDVACFFKGRSIEYTQKVLDGCGFRTTIGFQVLIERSLISEENGKFQMHDLVQSMGRDIVKGECCDDPGKRSRLWLRDDVIDVLSRNGGKCAITAIVLHLPKPEKMYIDPNAFTNMRKLRLLILDNIDTTFQGPIHLPSELRWVEWLYCAPIPEFRDAKKLVGLKMQNSKIQAGVKEFKDFKKLKFLSFRDCQSLVCTPDLDYTPNLENLNLYRCKNLEHVHKSVAYHGKLQSLNIRKCSELRHLCDVLQTESLKSLNLKDCSKLERFPDVSDKNQKLQCLILDGTAIEELPTSIENFVNLDLLFLNHCKKLASLPSSIYKLRNLTELQVSYCSKLIKFPEVPHSIDPHTETDLNSPAFWTELDVSGCRQLQEIFEIPRLIKLKAFGCQSLRKIPIDTILLYQMDLSDCHELVRIGLTVSDLVKPEQIVAHGQDFVQFPGEEMPKWLLPNQNGYISFWASKDIYEKIQAVVFCVVYRSKENIGCMAIEAYVNGKRSLGVPKWLPSLDSNHVYLCSCMPQSLWEGVSFGPNNYFNYFQLRIVVTGRVIVKKFGIRLLCKALENDLEVLMEENQLLDPALIYEVSDDSQTCTEEDRSSKFVHKLFNVADFSIEKLRYSDDLKIYERILLTEEEMPKDRMFLPGEEMPKEYVVVEDSTISFMASEDLYDKFLGLAFCLVFSVEDAEKEVSFDIVPQINGQMRNMLSGNLGSFNSDHTWFQILKPYVMWGMMEGAVDFDQFEESYLQFSLTVRVSGGTIKQLGYLIRCERLEDDLKVVLKDNPLVDQASFCEYLEDGLYCLEDELLQKYFFCPKDLEVGDSETD